MCLQLYDSHVTTRIAIAIVTCFFAAIASCALCIDLRDHHTVRPLPLFVCACPRTNISLSLLPHSCRT